MEKTKKKSPWSWVPSLYYAQGIPYVVVMTVSVIMYKRMGVSNTDIALYTSWLYLPWVIKPLWSPLVDLFKTKRWWIVTMQLLVGAGLAGVAFTLPLPSFFQYSLAFLWLLAFSSATHDIAADGFYMLGLKEGQQSYFIGIRSTFYRFAMITGQGLLIILAGFFEVFTGQEPVRFTVTADPQAQEIRPSVGFDNTGNFDELTFVITSEDVVLSTQQISKEEADSLKNFVITQNLANEFSQEEKTVEVSVSWWARTISQPFADWLRARIGRDEALDTSLDEYQGNLALVGVMLEGYLEEEREIVLNTTFRRGDGSVRLVGGDRLVFTSQNQHETAWLLVQLDPKLDTRATAYFEGRSGNIPLAWTLTFVILALLFLGFFIYHKIALPRPANDMATIQQDGKGVFYEFFQTFGSFFRKENIGPALAFLLLFRLGEAQIVKMASPFLLDPREIGGLGLTTGQVGIVYGTIGILALTLGGILGGLMASKKGLKFWIFPMAIAMNLPNLVFVYLSYSQPVSFWLISGSVALEQFGYGFGFTAYMLYMIYFSDGKHKTAHFAICTGLMALGMMIPGMISGWIQEIIGYQNFFIWVVLCTIPGFIIIRFLKIEKTFGIKDKDKKEE
ncbi:MAG: MFS transporter [Bacteroidetes bacterium]|nr:MAG: MFS transporter [Bacteroidota bacterium]